MRKPFITPNRIQAPRRRHCGQSVPQPSAGSASAWRRLMRGITTATPGACYAARRRPKLEAVAHVADRLFVGHRAGKRLSRFKGLEGPAGLPRRSQRYFRPPEAGIQACDQAIARQEPRAGFCHRHRNRQRAERNSNPFLQPPTSMRQNSRTSAWT
jgi:hypothetical protein